MYSFKKHINNCEDLSLCEIKSVPSRNYAIKCYNIQPKWTPLVWRLEVHFCSFWWAFYGMVSLRLSKLMWSNKINERYYDGCSNVPCSLLTIKPKRQSTVAWHGIWPTSLRKYLQGKHVALFGVNTIYVYVAKWFATFDLLYLKNIINSKSVATLFRHMLFDKQNGLVNFCRFCILDGIGKILGGWEYTLLNL